MTEPLSTERCSHCEQLGNLAWSLQQLAEGGERNECVKITLGRWEAAHLLSLLVAPSGAPGWKLDDTSVKTSDPMAWEALRRAEARLHERDGQTHFVLESLKWHVADQRKIIAIAREALSRRDASVTSQSGVWTFDARNWLKAILVDMCVALEAATTELETQAILDKAINEIAGSHPVSTPAAVTRDLVCKACGGWGEIGDYAEPVRCPDCSAYSAAPPVPLEKASVEREEIANIISEAILKEVDAEDCKATYRFFIKEDPYRNRECASNNAADAILKLYAERGVG